MSCQACKDFQKQKAITYHRWGSANVALMGCDRHIREIKTVLGNNQDLADVPIPKPKKEFGVFPYGKDKDGAENE